MGRLADKLAKANDAIASVEIAVEKDVDALIARTETIQRKREAVFFKKQSYLDQHVTDLAEFEKDLDAFGKNDHSGAGGSSGDTGGQNSGENTGNAYAGTNGLKT